MMISPGKIISTILKHDNKQTSYKIALLRAINDVVLSFPDIKSYQRDVAIPLRVLAEYWIAYYWPFIDSQHPIMQGTRSNRNGKLSNDLSFREELTYFRQLWENEWGSISDPADGFFIINELRIPRKIASYSKTLIETYRKTIQKVCHAIEQPIHYAGHGEWTIFEKPQRYRSLAANILPIPGTQPDDMCIVIQAELWESFRELSLWIEALCIHEWCLFTERINGGEERGLVYQLLTARPDNRRPLTWERNRIDLLLMEGKVFVYPWTEKRIKVATPYDVDHLIPVSVYPINELWNLVPTDPKFNMHVKRDRVPNTQRLQQAVPHLVTTYQQYLYSPDLAQAICEDVQVRFTFISCNGSDFAHAVTNAAIRFLSEVADARNLERF